MTLKMTLLDEIKAIAKTEDVNQLVGCVGYTGTDQETEFQKTYNYKGMENVGWYIVNTRTKSVECISLWNDDDAIDNPYTDMGRIAKILQSLGITEMPSNADDAYKKLLTVVSSTTRLPCGCYAQRHPLKWNPVNEVVQCYNCGTLYTPISKQLEIK